MAGKTIKLFYVNGDPTGLRVADVMNWAGMAVAVPRNHLPAFTVGVKVVVAFVSQ